MAFKEVSAHLRGPEDYELITYRLMQRLKEENVLHAEVYVAVGVCLFRKQDFAAIFEGLDAGARGARDFGVSLFGSSTRLDTSGSRTRRRYLNLRCAIKTATWLASASVATSRRLRRNFSAASTDTPKTMACA